MRFLISAGGILDKIDLNNVRAEMGMNDAFEDLEALKELNDELEENHVETEKQMQEDIGTIFIPSCFHSA